MNECTNIQCDKEGDKRVVFEGISTEPRWYCTEHYNELKQITNELDQ